MSNPQAPPAQPTLLARLLRWCRQHPLAMCGIGAAFLVWFTLIPMWSRGPSPGRWVYDHCIPTLDGISRSDNARIAFYGRIVDQTGAGVGDMGVKVRTLIHDGFDECHMDWTTVTTDSNGRFTIRGYGDSIHLEFGRSDLVTDSSPGGPPRTVAFGSRASVPHVADASKPVTYAVWRRCGGESLLDTRPHADLDANGVAYTVDLVKDEIRTGKDADGDLWLRVTKPESGGGDWTLHVEANGGGLRFQHDRFPYKAPETGYEPVFVTPVTKLDRGRFQADLYVRSREGKVFAALHLSAARQQYRETVHVGLHGLVNPAGSRNLEPDPAKIRQVSH